MCCVEYFLHESKMCVSKYQTLYPSAFNTFHCLHSLPFRMMWCGSLGISLIRCIFISAVWLCSQLFKIVVCLLHSTSGPITCWTYELLIPVSCWCGMIKSVVLIKVYNWNYLSDYFDHNERPTLLTACLTSRVTRKFLDLYFNCFSTYHIERTSPAIQTKSFTSLFKHNITLIMVDKSQGLFFSMLLITDVTTKHVISFPWNWIEISNPKSQIYWVNGNADHLSQDDQQIYKAISQA